MLQSRRTQCIRLLLATDQQQFIRKSELDTRVPKKVRRPTYLLYVWERRPAMYSVSSVTESCLTVCDPMN